MSNTSSNRFDEYKCPRCHPEPLNRDVGNVRLLVALDPFNYYLLRAFRVLMASTTHDTGIHTEEHAKLYVDRGKTLRLQYHVPGKACRSTCNTEFHYIIGSTYMTAEVFVVDRGKQAHDVPTYSIGITYCNNWIVINAVKLLLETFIPDYTAMCKTGEIRPVQHIPAPAMITIFPGGNIVYSVDLKINYIFMAATILIFEQHFNPLENQDQIYTLYDREIPVEINDDDVRICDEDITSPGRCTLFAIYQMVHKTTTGTLKHKGRRHRHHHSTKSSPSKDAGSSSDESGDGSIGAVSSGDVNIM